MSLFRLPRLRSSAPSFLFLKCDVFGSLFSFVFSEIVCRVVAVRLPVPFADDERCLLYLPWKGLLLSVDFFFFCCLSVSEGAGSVILERLSTLLGSFQ